ncbi:ABC transporter substrate-binding protein [Kitasatospora sp. NPDC057015]|uniref:ABC transporter substrate-binding protein n=1 Tax=Kitasatospora sp. NPDC057015 TaxID=3346001 RepID=UPI003636878D
MRVRRAGSRTRGGHRLVAAVLAATLAAAGCVRSDGRSEPGGESGPVTLVTGRESNGYLRGLLEAWNAGHPRERATLVQLPEAADEVRAQLAAGLAGGSDRFDVLNLDVVWTAEFASRHWITPLDGPDPVEVGGLLPQAVETGRYDGRLYAVPLVANVGLLYYRSDLLAQAGEQPPATWAELERLATEVAPRYGVDGYAGQLLPYEGLTVNVAEAVQSAGGRFLDGQGGVAVDGTGYRHALDFLAGGVRKGWIPRKALTYREEESREAFRDGRLLFLRGWPSVHPSAAAPDSSVAGRFGVVPLPGPQGPGTGVLGGSDLAVNSASRHQRTARELIRFLTGREMQVRALAEAGQPPARADLYSDPAVVGRFPYLPVVRRELETAVARPAVPEYQQLSLAISADSYQVLLGRSGTDEAARRLAADLKDVLNK